MAEFVRAEVRQAVVRYRDLLIGLGVAGLGLYWALASFGILSWIGWAMVPIGLLFLWTGTQRLRFRRGGGGPGVVRITERRVTYMGPLNGGLAEMDDLARLDLDPTSYPDPSWVLIPRTGEALTIPVTAEGADALFDLFATLPGLKTEALLSVLSRTPDARVIVWQNPREAATPSRRLH